MVDKTDIRSAWSEIVRDGLKLHPFRQQLIERRRIQYLLDPLRTESFAPCLSGRLVLRCNRDASTSDLIRNGINARTNRNIHLPLPGGRSTSEPVP